MTALCLYNFVTMYSCRTVPLIADCHKQGITCELSKKLLGRDIGEAVEVPAIAMATVWLIMLLPSPSVSSPPLPIAAPWGPPGRPHWLWDSSDTKRRKLIKINQLTGISDNIKFFSVSS